MKTGMSIVLGVVLATSADSARAQNIFIDRFNGSQLRPHWQQPPPEHWEHTVGGGQLTVTDLFHPGMPGQPNTATIAAEFPLSEVFDLVLTTSLGWEAGEGRNLTVSLWGPRGLVVAIGYDDRGPEPLIFLEVPGAPSIPTAPAPGPGTHEFKLVDDHGDGLNLYVDGVSRLWQGFGGGADLSRVDVGFAGTEGVPFSPLSVGLVRIVPSPGVLLALAGGFGTVAARGRR